jgi:hypothetical protein
MVRDYQPDDLPQIKDIHAAQGFDYTVPRLDDPLFLVKKVRVVDGRVVAAMFLRITAETFLLVQGSPEAKGRAIMELQPEVIQEAFTKGLSDVICVVPPEIASDFGPVMERLGWHRDREWPMYSRGVTSEMP